jgi:muramoyltetrapeptide carboxypeptidase
MNKPRALKKGGMIRAVAPASSEHDLGALNRGLGKLRDLGFNVSLGDCVRRMRTHGYLAGTDPERAAELNEAFRDDHVDAVFCVEGGYGTIRILQLLDYELMKSNAKIFLGYSDITALHVAMNHKSDLVTFHGPMIASELGSEFSAYTEKCLLRALTSSEPLGELQNPAEGPFIKTINEGEASGGLVGGNLSLIVKTLGTPYEIDTRNKILVIEDVDEAPYRIDGYLAHLSLAKKLSDAAGIVVGEMTKYEAKNPGQSLTLWDAFRDHIGSTGKPAIYGLCFGHGLHHVTLPLGVEAKLDATQGKLRIEEPATVT